MQDAKCATNISRYEEGMLLFLYQYSCNSNNSVVLQDDVLELMCDAMKKNISNTKCFLIDGYPRELEQGTRFENEVSRYPPVFSLWIDSFVVLRPA